MPAAPGHSETGETQQACCDQRHGLVEYPMRAPCDCQLVKQPDKFVPGLALFFILRILHEGHTPAAEAASTEGQQQDTAI
jgi:hypothetical protein